jgi:protein-tyrosine phosphatase
VLKAISRRLRAYRALITARRDTLRRLKQGRVSRVLVVCYGNIYRSAFVAACLRKMLPSTVELRGAGFHKVADRPAPPRHVAMCERFGVSLHDHRSRVISQDDVEWADTIILMDRHNWDGLHALRAPGRKLVWLGALSDGPVEIPDPYELNDAAAERIVQRMYRSCQRLVDALRTNELIDS